MAVGGGGGGGGGGEAAAKKAKMGKVTMVFVWDFMSMRICWP